MVFKLKDGRKVTTNYINREIRVYTEDEIYIFMHNTKEECETCWLWTENDWKWFINNNDFKIIRK